MRSCPRHAQSSSLHDLPRWVVLERDSHHTLNPVCGEPHTEPTLADRSEEHRPKNSAPKSSAPKSEVCRPVASRPKLTRARPTPVNVSSDHPSARPIARKRAIRQVLVAWQARPRHQPRSGARVRPPRPPRSGHRPTCLHVNGQGIVRTSAGSDRLAAQARPSDLRLILLCASKLSRSHAVCGVAGQGARRPVSKPRSSVEGPKALFRRLRSRHHSRPSPTT
jgi:hypothetical protein